MSIFKRPPGDMFTFRLFFKLTNNLKLSHDKIYIWSAVLDPTYNMRYGEEEWEVDTELKYRKKLLEEIRSDIVILGVKDHLTSGDFNYWKDKRPIIVNYLYDLFQFYKNKKFILFTSVEGLEHYINLPNVSIVPWGGDITNHQREYTTLEPVLEKNLDSNYTFLSLNRNKRAHRAMLLSLIHGLNIEKSGLVSCMFRDKTKDLFEYTQWNTTDNKFYTDGWNKLKNSNILLNDNPEIYSNFNNDNVSNFKNKLSNYYRETFVEIISETSYTEQCYNITEKTLNSIYGCSFPILLCSKGSVNFLRSMGLDMFDDIIDHSYDEIADPLIRLETAITKNQELLTNNQKTKQLWLDNKHRFQNNIDFSQKQLYNYYVDRSENVFKEVINGL